MNVLIDKMRFVSVVQTIFIVAFFEVTIPVAQREVNIFILNKNLVPSIFSEFGKKIYKKTVLPKSSGIFFGIPVDFSVQLSSGL